MKAYSFDADTGEYVGVSDIDPDPLDPENVPLPAFSTLAAPPAIPGGKQCHYVDGAWVLTDIPPVVVEIDPDAELNWNYDNAPTGLFGGPNIEEMINGYR